MELDFADPATVDVDVVIAEVNQQKPSGNVAWHVALWPGVIVKALADTITRRRAAVEDAVRQLDAMIAGTQLTIRRLENQGKEKESELASARLWGLLYTRNLLGTGTGVTQCAHVLHRSGGLDADGQTIWRCAFCDDVAPHGVTA